jgi:predicted O-methyltransferase YrrM
MISELEIYLQKCSSPIPAYLNELERETYLKILKPHMITGFAQGRLLALFSKLLNSRFVLEIGTFTGYGTLCLAEGMHPDGKLITLDVSEENTWLAQKYFLKSPYSHIIELITGPAEETIPPLNFTWDLVYIDADKMNNERYLELVWPNLRVGGIVLIDNVFAHGGIWKENPKPFEQAIINLNERLPKKYADATVTMLPIRDGLTVISKN